MRHGVRESFQFAVRRRKLRCPFRDLLLKDCPALLDFVEHFVEGLGEECHFVAALRHFGSNRVVLFSRYNARSAGKIL